MTNSVQKGKVGEREVVKMFRRWYPDCKRSFGQARDGGEQPDIIGGGVEDDFFIEVKRYSTKSFRPGQLAKWWEKLISDQVKYQKLTGDDSMGAPPIIVYRITGTKPVQWFVICYVQDFACLFPDSVREASPQTMIVPWGHFAKMIDELYTKGNVDFYSTRERQLP